MAENQYVNKVTYGTNEDGTENVLIDLSKDTVDSAHLAEGYIAHNKTGAIINGVAKIGEGSVDITENGTYDVKQYAEANVNVLVGTDVSDSTLDQYKIYDGEIGYGADGEKITGRLNNWSAVVAGGGGHVIQLYCPFAPKEANVHCYGTPNSKYQVINLMIWLKGGFRKYSSGELEQSAYYFAHTTGTSSTNMISHQIVLADNQTRFTYDETSHQVYIRTPDDSNYKFQSVNYRVILSR